MGRPVHADGRQTRQAILDAALDLFAEKGYFGTSLRDIATVVGVRESALYNYFSSKEALFNALLELARESTQDAWADFRAQPMTDVRSVLESLTVRVLDFFCDPRQQRMFLLMSCDGMRLAKQGRLDLIQRMTDDSTPLHELMRQLIAEGWVRKAEPQVLVMAFIGPLIMWRNRHAIAPTAPMIVNRNKFIREHVNQFLCGAEPPAAGSRAGSTVRHAASSTSATARRPRRRPRVAS
jgi:AcrR family transcriptional regulator